MDRALRGLGESGRCDKGEREEGKTEIGFETAREEHGEILPERCGMTNERHDRDSGCARMTSEKVQKQIPCYAAE